MDERLIDEFVQETQIGVLNTERPIVRHPPSIYRSHVLASKDTTAITGGATRGSVPKGDRLPCFLWRSREGALQDLLNEVWLFVFVGKIFADDLAGDVLGVSMGKRTVQAVHMEVLFTLLHKLICNGLRNDADGHFPVINFGN